MSPGKYLLTVAVGFTVYFAVTAVLTVGVDPFGMIPLERAMHTEKVRMGRIDNDRLIKAYDPILRPAKIIFAGTSRTKQGIDPSAIEAWTGGPVYNAGIDAGLLVDSARHVDFHARHVPGLRHIYIELFPGLLGPLPVPEPPPTSAEHLSNLLRVTLGGTALRASVETVLVERAVRRGATMPPFTRLSGFYPVRAHPCANCTFEAFVGKGEWRSMPMDFDIGPNVIRFLRDIREQAGRHGVDVSYYLPPYHSWVAYSFHQFGNWKALEELKRKLAEVGGAYDFFRYNEIMDEALAPQMKYWFETGHYRPEMGRLMAGAMLDRPSVKVPANFGLLLDPATIEAELAEFRAERDAWIARNPQVVDSYRRTAAGQ